ncbi:uncharacterized protein [Physcomitrium patens]|uniref:Uncharacterized protein n=1 Tax=Physcomitrium patens TaxID=3218 RepID=A0A2K1KMR6_PHYPA|nr:E3 ubiquitin-protein ligase TRIM37-like [Physcomitrium patens]XP_024373647.1 E3 ubiquitin-protein ligase TRIM37-like [Physcomitrium patens]PNR55072.1 hypothetical protein PHYPA_005965 [Physcomitrium patens]|eukprot:XP_024373646.1 E3 ubiquitin-protein ligase TRIM37-like [Physcomitrella patens]
MAAAATLRGTGRNSRSNNSTCTRLVSGPVIATSPFHTLDYDCTDCGSFLFGQRGRLRLRPPGARSTSHNHDSCESSISETAQAQVQRLLLDDDSLRQRHPSEPVESQQMVVPQNEQIPALAPVTEPEDTVDYRSASGLSVSNDVSEPSLLQPSENEVEDVGIDREIDFVACQGASPVVAENDNDSSSALADIFRCFICLGKVVEAQLCPCCSKLVCQPCIKRWLTDQKSECPHCRAPLLVSQLVSCRFISEISTEVEKIQGKLGDSPMEKYCPAHDSPLLYFCSTCAVAVCSDCAVLIEDHRNHTFEKLSVAYGRHKKKIRMEAAGLRRRRKELSLLVASVDKNIESVLKSKDESVAELQVAFKKMQSRLEEQLKCKLLALLSHKASMTQEMELLDTILQELDQQLSSIPKSDLIAQEPNMSRMLQDIRTRTFSHVSRSLIPSEFISEVVPSYEYGELVLKNYKENLSQVRSAVFVPGGTPNISQILLNKDVVYSKPICASGVAWRLKVYPNGSGASQGTHLSVFLEMVKGGHEPATYEYGIELLHPTRPNQRIIRKFSSDFEMGACWGYCQFFRIDLLEKEGYLQPTEDTIVMRFYVRPLTYKQQCQDLQRALAELQVERDESITQVAIIRRAFAATFFQRRRRRSIRLAGCVGDEEAAIAQAVAAGTGTNVSSPTLAVRKVSHIPSIKHFQVKMQEYSGTRSKSWISGTSPQAGIKRYSESAVKNFEISAADTGDSAAQQDEDDTRAPSVERFDTTRRTDRKQEPWTKNREEAIHRGKMRVHRKPRSRKSHKLALLAPEAVLPFIGLPDTTVPDLSVMEANPSVAATQIRTAPVSAGESSSGDEKCEEGFLDVEGLITTSGLPSNNVLGANIGEGVEDS